MSRTTEFHLDQQHDRDLDHEEIDDAREHEREITNGFDDDQLTEGDPCWLPRATEPVSRS